MSERLTLAASTGLPFFALALHVAAGTVGLVTGWIAMVARKGGVWHRRGGVAFVYSMVTMGLVAVGISVYEGKADVAGGAAAAYLIFTGWTAIRPPPGMGRSANVALMLLAWFFALGGFRQAFVVLGMPGSRSEGVPAGMHFFLSSIFLLAAVGDLRMIYAGGLQGTRRLARHLWRMCFGLFIATGSFAAQLVRMTFMPSWTRSLLVILILSAGPLRAALLDVARAPSAESPRARHREAARGARGRLSRSRGGERARDPASMKEQPGTKRDTPRRRRGRATPRVHPCRRGGAVHQGRLRFACEH